MEIVGIVIRGKGIASGIKVDPVTGLTNTIAKQKPFFSNQGVENMSDIFNGTINLDISPRKFKILKPDYEIECREWSLGVTETFQLVSCLINYKKSTHKGYIYYPCTSPVKSHKDNVVELLAPFIEGVNSGSIISIQIQDGKVRLK